MFFIGKIKVTPGNQFCQFWLCVAIGISLNRNHTFLFMGNIITVIKDDHLISKCLETLIQIIFSSFSQIYGIASSSCGVYIFSNSRPLKSYICCNGSCILYLLWSQLYLVELLGLLTGLGLLKLLHLICQGFWQGLACWSSSQT